MTKDATNKPTQEDIVKIVDKIKQVMADFEFKINWLESQAAELKEANDANPEMESLQKENAVLDILIQTRDEYGETLQKLMKQLDADTRKYFEQTGIIDFPGYYKAPHNMEIKEVYDLIFTPSQAMFDPDAKEEGDRYRSEMISRTGERLAIYWGREKLNQEGVMLPQYIRKLWLLNPAADQVKFNLMDYIKLRGLENPSRTYEIMARELLKLAGIRIYYNLDGKTRGGHGFIGTHLREGGEVLITLTQETLSMFRAAGKQFHQYPDALFQVNLKLNPMAWNLGMYFADQKSVYWKHWDGNAIIFDNAELLQVSGLDEDAVRAGGSHFIKEIVRKIERDLNAIADAYQWDYYPECGQVWAGSWKQWKAGKTRVQYINCPYDLIDKQAARDLDQKKRETAALATEDEKARQKVKAKQRPGKR